MELGRVLAERALVPHPDGVRPSIAIGVRIAAHGRDALRVDYAVTGDLADLVLPAAGIGTRRDGLWRSTCFELFLRFPGGSYTEYNFAPSTDWAVYRFDSYRSGMQPDDAMPDFHIERSADRFGLTACIALPGRIASAGLTAVIETVDGAKTYWALAHPPGAPDFHADACFALRLPAAASR